MTLYEIAVSAGCELCSALSIRALGLPTLLITGRTILRSYARPANPFIRLSSLSTLARLVRSANSVRLSIQFVEQGFCLAERGRVEAFREPAVNFGD